MKCFSQIPPHKKLRNSKRREHPLIWLLPAYFRNQKVESSRFRLEKALEIRENAASIRARTLDTEAVWI